MATFNMTFLSRDKPIEMTFDSVIQHTQHIVDNPYPGPYVVTPKVDYQTLETKHHGMTDDVLVKAIPYAETSNDFGTTVVIAS